MTHHEPEYAEQDTCRDAQVDGETIRVRGSGDLTPEGREALTALVRVAKAKFASEAAEQVGVLQNRLRLAHKARRAKEHQLDDIRRALCDAGFMEDDDPYSHADLADVIRQAGEAAWAAPDAVASELHRRAVRLEELRPFKQAACLGCPVVQVDGEVIGLRGALGIVLGGTVPGGTADERGQAYYQAWQARQEGRDAR